jgi:hypothetical protein
MNVLLRAYAAILDLLQLLFFVVLLTFQVMTPLGGAATGGVSAAVLCWNLSSGAWSSVVNAASCLAGGGLLGAGLGALGGPIGIAIDITLSCTFGLLLVIMLAVSGRLSFFPLIFTFVGETAPVLNAFIPAWSILVHRCIKAHKAKGSPKVSASSVVSLLASGGAGALRPPTTAFAGQVAERRYGDFKKADETKTGRAATALVQRNFDGIRPSDTKRPHAQTA